jgi:hypothetical protein
MHGFDFEFALHVINEGKSPTAFVGHQSRGSALHLPTDSVLAENPRVKMSALSYA